jgi:6-pyruvoyltetrahydropterin/6-carboxytetrahydropterin synthase
VKGDISQEKGTSAEGMVLDFSDIKTILKTEIHDICDHAFMVYEGDAILIDFFHANPNLKVVIVPFIPTAEYIAQWTFDILDACFKKTYSTALQLEKVCVWETPTSKAEISSLTHS